MQRPDLTRSRVVVVGDVMLDRYWFGDAQRLSPEAPVPVVLVTREEHRLGGAANVARNVASLGAQASMLGVVGSDEPGRQLRSLLRDDRLYRVVQLALQNNRDLRVSLLNVEKSQAQLRLADADRWPTVSAALIGTRAPNTAGQQVNTFQGGLQLSSYELDLFGRVRNASEAASATLLGTEAAARSARLSLATQTASAWLTRASAAAPKIVRVLSCPALPKGAVAITGQD